MNLPVDERLVSTQLNLIKERDAIVARKMQLLNEFRAYALNKFRQSGKPFVIKYRSINGDSKIHYRDLKMGDSFVLKYGSFTFNPKTNMLTDCVQTVFCEVKRTEDFDQLAEISTSRLREFRAKQKTLDAATRLEQQRIEIMTRKKVQNILDRIFKGDLVFDDSVFKKLVETNIALEQEYQALNAKIESLNIINGSPELDGNKKIDVNHAQLHQGQVK